jgi:hypothetical protein
MQRPNEGGSRAEACRERGAVLTRPVGAAYGTPVPRADPDRPQGTRHPGRIHINDFRALRERSETEPVCFGRIGERNYWRFGNRWFWDNEGLTAADVRALVVARDQRRQCTLNRAHTTADMASRPARAQRSAIPADVKQLVWRRDRGQCRGCGANTDAGRGTSPERSNRRKLDGAALLRPHQTCRHCRQAMGSDGPACASDGATRPQHPPQNDHRVEVSQPNGAVTTTPSCATQQPPRAGNGQPWTTDRSAAGSLTSLSRKVIRGRISSFREITQPEFKHDIATVARRGDLTPKKSGRLFLPRGLAIYANMAANPKTPNNMALSPANMETRRPPPTHSIPMATSAMQKTAANDPQ